MWDGSGSLADGVIINIIVVVEAIPTRINLPTKWCGGVGGIFDGTPADINIPFDGSGRLDTPTNSVGSSDGRLDGTPRTVIPTGGGGCPDVRCRWDWGVSGVNGTPTGAVIPIGGGDRFDVRCRRDGESSSTR